MATGPMAFVITEVARDATFEAIAVAVCHQRRMAPAVRGEGCRPLWSRWNSVGFGGSGSHLESDPLKWPVFGWLRTKGEPCTLIA